MEDKELNKFSMFRSVISTGKEFSGEVDTFPAMKSSYDRLGAQCDTIEKLNDQYQTVAKGVTANKNFLKAMLADKVDQMYSAVYTLGKDTGDTRLTSLYDTTLSELGKSRDSFLLEKAKGLAEIVKSKETELKSYDVTSEKIAKFDELITSYDLSLNNKDSKGREAVLARGNLSKAIDGAMEIIVDELDNHIKQRKDSNPAFYENYQQARIVKDLGGTHGGGTGNNPPTPPASNSTSTPSNPPTQSSNQKAS